MGFRIFVPSGCMEVVKQLQTCWASSFLTFSSAFLTLSFLLSFCLAAGSNVSSSSTAWSRQWVCVVHKFRIANLRAYLITASKWSAAAYFCRRQGKRWPDERFLAAKISSSSSSSSSVSWTSAALRFGFLPLTCNIVVFSRLLGSKQCEKFESCTCHMHPSCKYCLILIDHTS